MENTDWLKFGPRTRGALERREADATALRDLRAALVHLGEALAGVRHYTALAQIGDALKAARHAENSLRSSLEEP